MAMNNMGAGFVLTGVDKASPVVNRFRGTLSGLRAALGGVGMAMAAIGGASLKMGKGITGGLMKAADAAGNFEQGIASVGAVTKASTAEVEALRDAAIQAGIETQFSPDQAVAGLQSLATAGQMATEATKTLIPVLDLAAGSLGQLGVAEAAEAVVGTLNAYGMEADRAAEVTDKLLRVTQLTNFQARDFEAGLAKAAATGGIYEQSLNDVLITLGMMRNRNIDASSAATNYREALRRVGSDAGAQNAIMEAGVDVFDKQTGKMREIVDVMLDFDNKTKDMTASQRNMLINQAFGARGMLAFAAVQKSMFTTMEDGEKVVYRGADAIDKLREQMANAKGTAKEFREALLDTYKGQKTLLAGTLDTIMIAFGEPLAKLLKPVVSFIIDSANNLLKAFESLPMPVKKFLTGIAGVGGTLLTVVGGFIVLIGVMRIFGVTLFGLISSVGAFVGIMIPLTLLVAGLGVGFVAASKAMRKETKNNESTWEMMARKIKWAYQGVVQILKNGELSAAFTKQLESMNETGVLKFLRGFEAFTERMKHFWDGLVMGFEIGVAQLGPNIQRLKDEFGGIFDLFSDDPTGETMEKWVDNGISAGETLASLGGVVIDMFTNIVKWGKEVSKSMRGMTATGITASIKEAVDNFNDLIYVLKKVWAFFRMIGRAVSGIFNAIQTVGAAIGEGLGFLVSGADPNDKSGFIPWTETKKQFGEMVNAFAGEDVFGDEKPSGPRQTKAEQKRLSEVRTKQLQTLAGDLRFEAATLEQAAEDAKTKKKREQINEELAQTMAKLNTVLDRLERSGVKAQVSYEAVADAANQHAANDAGRNLSPNPELAMGF